MTFHVSFSEGQAWKWKCMKSWTGPMNWRKSWNSERTSTKLPPTLGGCISSSRPSSPPLMSSTDAQRSARPAPFPTTVPHARRAMLSKEESAKLSWQTVYKTSSSRARCVSSIATGSARAAIKPELIASIAHSFMSKTARGSVLRRVKFLTSWVRSDRRWISSKEEE